MIPEHLPSFYDLSFYLFAAVTIFFGGVVAFGRNIIYSAFSLLGCFTAVAGLYVLLAADFLGVLQLFVYVGGITVLMIFAVMFTSEIGDVKIANQSMSWKMALPTVGLTGFLLYRMINDAPWKMISERNDAPTVSRLGDLFLSQYLLPFELISVLLLVALIGAIVIARRDVPATDDVKGAAK